MNSFIIVVFIPISNPSSNQYSPSPIDTAIDTLVLAKQSSTHYKKDDTQHTPWRVAITQRASQIAGISLDKPALHLPNTRLIEPKKCANAILTRYENQIHYHPNTQITHWDIQPSQVILTDNQQHTYACDHVIIANANPQALWPAFDSNIIKRQAGQLTFLKMKNAIALNAVLSYGGYTLPFQNQLLMDLLIR